MVVFVPVMGQTNEAGKENSPAKYDVLFVTTLKPTLICINYHHKFKALKLIKTNTQYAHR